MNYDDSPKFSQPNFGNIRCPHCDGLLSKDKDSSTLWIRVHCKSRACGEDVWLPYVTFWGRSDGLFLAESLRVASFYIKNVYHPFPQSRFRKEEPGCSIYKIVPASLPGYLEDRYEIITTLSQPISLPLDNLSSIEKEIISYAIFS